MQRGFVPGRSFRYANSYQIFTFDQIQMRDWNASCVVLNLAIIEYSTHK